jgi:transcriptional regulator with XRE-family HTH domain
MHTRKELAEQMINRRAVLGITQEQLSSLSGVGLKTIYKLEQGLGNPSLDTLEKVLEVLGLELNIKLKK